MIDDLLEELQAAGRVESEGEFTLDRAKAHAQIQEKVMKEHLWIPVMNVKMYQTTNKKLKGARAHMLYQYTFYKGLDVSP